MHTLNELAQQLANGTSSARSLQREFVIRSVDRGTRGFDALVMPTVPIIPPPLAAFANDADYARLNALVR